MLSWSVSLFYASILLAFLFSMVIFLARSPTLNGSDDIGEEPSAKVLQTTDE